MKKIKPVKFITTCLLSSLFACMSLHASEYFAEIPIEEAIDVEPNFLNHKKVSELPEGPGPFLIEFGVRKKHFRDTLHPYIRLRGLFCKAENPKALLLGVHGMQSNHRWYKGTCETLAKNGISALFYDRRGSGLSDGIDPYKFPIGQLASGNTIDPNSNDIKIAPGLRGHVKTGILLKRFYPSAKSISAHFLLDIESAYHTLLEIYEDYDLPVHIFANCFGSRIAFPFVHEHEDKITSMIVTSPATDMRDNANYVGLVDKLKILTPAITLIGGYDYVKTPLEDSFFVSPGSEAYREMGDDTLSLSLRYVTTDFLWGANKLTGMMFKGIERLKTPLLIATADQDQIVRNQDIRNRFMTNYQGNLKMIGFRSEHMIEFSPARESFWKILIEWINNTSQNKSKQAVQKSYRQMPYVNYEKDKLSASSESTETLQDNAEEKKGFNPFKIFKKKKDEDSSEKAPSAGSSSRKPYWQRKR